MENEKIIIEFVLRMLEQTNTQEMEIMLSILLKLLNKFPSYQWDEVIKAVCEEGKAC